MIGVRDLTMRYPGVTALQRVSLEFVPGRIHGLIGENGAGKSTLLKVLSGIQAPTEGTVVVDRQSVTFRGVRDAESAGIAMIHQELNLVPTLTVAENLALGHEPRRGLFLDRAEVRRRAALALKRLAIPFSGRTPLGDLPLAAQQMVEIAKAIARGARLVIMDEPTAVLAEPETRRLLQTMRELRADGVGLIYVSHRLDEVTEVCDDVSVLRDGHCVGTFPNHGLAADQLAEKMVGRTLDDVYPAKGTATAEVLLAVKDLRIDGLAAPVSLELRAGEIVGLGGLIGSGRTEIGEALAGFRACHPRLRGRAVYVSEDRKGTGLHLSLPIFENVTLASLRRYCQPWREVSRQRMAADAWVRRIGIKASSLDAPVASLSGGNQQKVSLAKWLDTQPRVLILDEPTRGVDIGAKVEIYHLIAELAAQGMACLVISSELNELLGLCHRILVMRERKMVGEVSRENLSESAVMRLAAGVAA